MCECEPFIKFCPLTHTFQDLSPPLAFEAAKFPIYAIDKVTIILWTVVV